MTAASPRTRTIAITGASGLIGSSLSAWLRAAGHRVVPMVRSRQTQAGVARWSPHAGLVDARELDGVDVVVHLAGESIATLRWTPKKKRRIRDSRAEGTHALASSLASLPAKPEALLCASGVHYYGDRKDAVLDESSPPGQGFLSEVCREWELAADPAREAGIRVAHLRHSMVLSSQGGALPKMLIPFKLGLGGVLGSGGQWMSWIALEDVVRIFEAVIEAPELEGPINCVAPEPVTNREFTRTLGRVLQRPTFLPVPGAVLRLALGEMADSLLLGSMRAVPGRLLEHGFGFTYERLEPALRSVLGRPA